MSATAPLTRSPVIELRNVSKTFGEVRSLSDINFSVYPGEIVGLLGDNGAGKSTLVKTIARELEPLTGTLTEGKGLHIGYFAQQELDVLRPADTPLELFRITAVFQHLGIMIAFEHYRVEIVQHGHHVRRLRAGIGQQAKAAGAIAENKLRGLARIMRHGIRFDLDGINRKFFCAIEHPDIINTGETRNRGLQGAVGQPDRRFEFARETRDATNVIVMFMRNQNGIYRFGSDTQSCQPANGIGKTKPAISQYPRASRLDQQPIALTAAAQRCEPHHARMRRRS